MTAASPFPETAPPTLTLAAIETRMERLPLLRWHWLMLGIVGIAQAIELIDSLAVSFSLPVLIKLWGLTPAHAGILVSTMYAGQMIGGGSFGWLSDRVGRLRLLRWSTAALVLLGLVAASAQSYNAFLVARFFQGIAFGGELLLATAYVAELSATAYRGRLIFGLNVAAGIGGILAAAIAAYVVPHFGWRWVFVAAAIGSIPFFIAARVLPESPRWLAYRGRAAEADAIVSGLELRAVASNRAATSPAADLIATDGDESVGRWRDLFDAEFRSRTLLLWAMAMSVGLVGITMISWLPRFFQLAYSVSLQNTLVMSAIPFTAPLLGALLGAAIVDRIRRDHSLLLGFTALSVSLLAMRALFGTTPIPVAVGLAFLTVLSQVFLLYSLFLVMVEYYPTRLRGIGAGAARFWLGVSAVMGPVGAGFISGRWGVPGTLGTMFVIALVGTAATILLVITTTRRIRNTPT